MTKSKFLEKLNKELSFLQSDERESRLAFYSEMIDDRIEEGLSEDEAVAAIGDIDKIKEQLMSEIPVKSEISSYQKAKKDTAKKSRGKLSALAIVLIAIGSPLWISIGAAAFFVIVSVYAAIWTIAGSMWSLPASLAAAFLGGISTGVENIVYGNTFAGVALTGAAIICAGLAIFAAFGCFRLTRLAVFLSKAIARFIKNLFVRKEKDHA